jgi:hypothetical protein
MIRQPTRLYVIRLAAFALSCFILSNACAKSPESPTSPSTGPAGIPAPPGGDVTPLGETINGTITSADYCESEEDRPIQYRDLCDTFTVRAPASGTVVATAEWTADAPLALRFRTATGEFIDASCCGRPAVGRVPVLGDSVLQVELAYIGRPSGYPNINPVPYTLKFALETGDQRPRETLTAIVFGDVTRTQQLPFARLEILDGPLSGTLARFDEITGQYQVVGLPPGFVRVRTSAAGFDQLEEQVVVGAQIPRRIVLQRTEPLRDATHTLSGTVRQSGAPNAALVEVKIEILDGPLAGVFTFTDIDMGIYTLASLPPGVIHVRASKGGFTQTLSVDISAPSTGLVFEFGTR